MKIGQYDIAGSQNLFNEMQSLSTQAQNPFAIPGQTNKQINNTSSANFGDMLSNAINNVNDLAHDARNKTNAFEMGDQSVSLAEVMITKEKAGVAFEATMHVRNKVLEAYEKIMQTPV
ncbi:flagellar hook-basal body complex protein FliE [Catenovulum sp. SM1970]|uniref:flagellar hook-basal body complex protein FliE n=1 Tax=Marinifaba aquimaris TaxID=2741323 RepID=UPI001571F86A|nr:flagellar hook-basal body complex protein FliE [Marinifaba aquimaris]NTS76396.1 flagellar hook-basal body complex protein FliE [Marinifaba aquimaris]